MVEVREQEKTKPISTMDNMFLSNVNQLSGYIDENATSAESGTRNSLVYWKVNLKELYRNIWSFLIPQIQDRCDNTFNELDKLMPPMTRNLPNTDESLQRAYQLLSVLTTLLFNARNELFVRLTTPIQPKTMGEKVG